MTGRDVFVEIAKVVVTGILALVLAVGLGALYGYLIMVLWNWLLPELFGFKAITWIQGWGISVFASLLFQSTTSSSSKK